ncbi:recombinase family protein [Ruminococcus sp. OA3]|uniref:recombinase family protein n=1 Tax=Ruminococcus sp. OA3 TaxID=2914164 RepID=UPI001F0566E5|nr:recombinase family protein [Ruminococcus sp. OA3]MCH1984101.1 recombinase family protein [Ruminococcus sp. OA3]
MKLLRCAVYIRVSSDEQAKYGDSMRDQKERGIEYIKTRKDAILQGIYIDDGVSGQKLDRGDFSNLMGAVKNQEIDLIVFTKLDRWFRNLRHYLNTQAMLEENGVAWIAIDQPYFDTSTPHGRAFVAQSMMWAELEAQNDGIRIRDVFRNKVKYGEVITGKVPRGYRIQDKHLVLSDEAPAIRDSIMYYLKTNSLNATLRYMSEEYQIIMTLQNLKSSILKNEKYTGKYRGNEHYCPRLITDEDFARIQKALSRNIRSHQKYDYLFSGLLSCAECGSRLNACQIHVVVKRNSGKIYRYCYPAYQCRQHAASGTCSMKGKIRETQIEKALLETLKEELETYKAVAKISESRTVDNRPRKSAIKNKMQRLKELYLNNAISIDEYKSDRLKLEQELCSLPDIEKPSKNVTDFKEFMEYDFKSLYDLLENAEKRRFWRSFISDIRISKSSARTCYMDVSFL